MTGRSRHDELRPTLEELLERGEVQSALIVKGKFSQAEIALIRAGWEKAHEVLLPALAAAEARAERAEAALREIAKSGPVFEEDFGGTA